MDDFHFLRPLWLSAALPALALWWALWRRQDRLASWRQFMDPHLLPYLLVGESTNRRVRPIQLLLVIWVVSVIALAGPAWRTEPLPFADDQAGLVVILKISGTMLATDVQPSRLERAKQKLRDLLEQRKGSATGLVVYSGSAHLVMPLTRDDRIISTMVADLTPELMPLDGDALVQALQLAKQMLVESGVPGSVVVIADSVSPTQVQALSADSVSMPVQFLTMQSPTATIDSGIRNAASILNASVVKLTFDQADVENMARSARTKLTVVSAANEGTRWQDSGYALLPLLAFLALMWSRRGWLVR